MLGIIASSVISGRHTRSKTLNISTATAISLKKQARLSRTIASPQRIGLAAGVVNRKTINVALSHSMGLTAGLTATPSIGAGGIRSSARILQPARLQIAPVLQINWKHPLANGLVHFEMFDQLRRTDHPFMPQMIGSHGTLTIATATAARPGPGGYGLSMTATAGGMSATSGNLLRVPQSEGSYFAYVTAEFSPTDGAQHYVTQIGKEAPSGSEQMFHLLKFNDNNLYFGWYINGAGSRGVVAASGLWSAGDTFMLGGTWDASDVRLFVKGKQAANKGSAPTTGNTTTATAVYRLGGLQSGSASWGNNAGRNFIYYTAIWNRALSATECNYLNQNPYCFLMPSAPRP